MNPGVIRCVPMRVPAWSAISPGIHKRALTLQSRLKVCAGRARPWASDDWSRGQAELSHPLSQAWLEERNGQFGEPRDAFVEFSKFQQHSASLRQALLGASKDACLDALLRLGRDIVGVEDFRQQPVGLVPGRNGMSVSFCAANEVLPALENWYADISASDLPTSMKAIFAMVSFLSIHPFPD
jgi:hypothetical protein